jgi:1-phosphatidylinositol-3-phosphate 5-kinase
MTHLRSLPIPCRESVPSPTSRLELIISSLAYLRELSGTKKLGEEGSEVTDSAQSANSISGWKVEVRRRDNVQDLFTLRNITKKQTDVSGTPSKPPAMAVTHPMPSLELSLEQVHGQSESHNHLGDFVKSISKAASLDPILAARTDSPHFSSHNASPSLTSWHEDAATDEEEGWGSPKRSVKRRSGLDHVLPEAMKPISRCVSVDGTSVPITPNTSAGLGTPMREEGWGSMTSNFTSALMKMGSGLGETLGSFRMKGGDRSLSSMLGPLSSMSQTDNALANSGGHRLPHIVFTYTLGEKLKLSCTVYFAEAFDSLRRRCAIEKAMIESLSEVENWDASGGKSKAAFFMTKDKRFIVKELVAGWIGSDTYVRSDVLCEIWIDDCSNAMLELAPEYFRYMQSTHNKATSLVKIAGFFSGMPYSAGRSTS